MTSLNPQDIKNTITICFDKIEFPKEAPLLYKERCLHDECRYIDSVFGRRNWWEVSPPIGGRFREDIFDYFSQDALTYYFPSFVVSILDSYENADIIVDRVLGLLRDEFNSRTVGTPQIHTGNNLLFTLRQIKGIISFLIFMRDNHDEGDAFEILEILGCEA